jgi:hypothetical protein
VVKKVLGVIAALLALAIVGGVYLLNSMDARGRSAVMAMCAKDGGPNVSETVFAPGFLTDNETTATCALCEAAVGKETFEYVDYQAKHTGMYIEETGYYRVSLSTKGDARCEAYLRAKEKFPYLLTPQDHGRRSDQCYAIERLPDRPKGYVLSQQFRRTPAPNGYALGVVETFVRYEPTGRTLAVNRDYLYTGATSTLLAGPGGITDATCPNAQGWRFDQLSMTAAVIRDEEKR